MPSPTTELRTAPTAHRLALPPEALTPAALPGPGATHRAGARHLDAQVIPPAAGQVAALGGGAVGRALRGAR